MTLASLIQDAGGRKFTYAILGVIIALVLVIANKITGEAFLVFFSTVGGLYIIGNVSEKAVLNSPVDPTAVAGDGTPK
jgi:hypothetical protein